jgi:hypothetical protein
MAWADTSPCASSVVLAAQETAAAETSSSAQGSVTETAPTEQTSTFAIYGWLAGIDADLRAGILEGSVDASFSDILDNLDLGFMAYYETWEETGFYLDVVHVRLGDTVERPILTLDYDVTQTLIEAGALLRRGTPDRGVDTIIGVRYVELENEIGLTPPGASASSSEHWLDPVVGVRYRAVLSDQWTGSIRGDIGGFGLGTDFSWQLIGAARYRLNPKSSLAIGYRYLNMDYDEDGFAFDGAMHGPVIGLAFDL